MCTETGRTPREEENRDWNKVCCTSQGAQKIVSRTPGDKTET